MFLYEKSGDIDMDFLGENGKLLPAEDTFVSPADRYFSGGEFRDDSNIERTAWDSIKVYAPNKTCLYERTKKQ